MACDCTSNYVSVSGYLLFVLILAWGSQSCYGLRTFALDVQQRFTDPNIGILAVDHLPKKGSLQYYAAMVHHDRVLHGRRLASSTDQGSYTFFNGNQTVQISSMALLHYANISVGTPSLSYLVALDTGSEMFWLPCNCSSCPKGWVSPYGNKINFNMYSPDASSTSSKVPCSSVLCELQDECPAKSNQCPYNVSYVSYRTSTAGLLVEDVLHLTTNDDQLQNDVAARITFGCSMDQTGLFQHGGPLNGLLGLGIGDLSVPSILAKDGLTSNSFSMCFGPDGLGRINFGDKGSSDQGETPLNVEEFYPVYNISITQINVGGVGTDLNFTALFDSGSAFTHLMDPAYTLISKSFNAQAKQKRLPFDPVMPFEYCYEISPNETDIETTIPTLNLTMKGGDHFVAFNATINGGNLYCLAILKSEDLSIIGQHLMTGYRVVFDRKKMVLGWKASDCYNPEKSDNSLPINPGNNTVAVSPAVDADPGVTRGTPVGSPISGASPPLSNNSSRHRSLPMVLILLVEGIIAALFNLNFGFSESAGFSKFALS